MSEKNALDYFDKNESTYQEIMEAMQDKPFLERLKATINGIGKPKDSGEYKMAKLQLQLWTAPIIAGIGVVTMLALLLIFGSGKTEENRTPPAEVLEPQEAPELDDPEPEQEIEPQEVEDYVTDISTPVPNVNVQNPVNQPLSPKPAPMNSVAIVKSPIMMPKSLDKTRMRTWAAATPARSAPPAPSTAAPPPARPP